MASVSGAPAPNVPDPQAATQAGTIPPIPPGPTGPQAPQGVAVPAPVAQVVVSPPVAPGPQPVVAPPVPGPPTGGQPPQGGPSGPQAPPPTGNRRTGRWPLVVLTLLMTVGVLGMFAVGYFIGRAGGERSAATQMATPTAVAQPSAAPAVTAPPTQVAAAVPSPTPVSVNVNVSGKVEVGGKVEVELKGTPVVEVRAQSPIPTPATPAAPVATAPTVKPTQVPTAAPVSTPPVATPAVASPQRFRDITGKGATKSWTLYVLQDEVGIVGGWQIDGGPVGGTYRALPPGTYQLTVVDGFVETMVASFGPTRFCELVGWAIRNGAGYKYVYPLPGWPAC